MLNPQQFGDGYSMPVLGTHLYPDAEVSPTTPRPPDLRPPNVYRTKAGDSGLRRGPNPNAMRQGDPRPLEISGELSEKTGIPEGTYPVVDSSPETLARSRRWPVKAPGPKMGMN